MSTNENNQLPMAKDGYSFDRVTRELLGTVRVFLAPIEGVYFLPENVVEVAPTAVPGPNQKHRLNAAGDAWEVVADFRRVMLWDTATVRPVLNTLQLGELPPVGVTAVQPAMYDERMPLRNVWGAKAKAWREDPDFSRFAIYDKATGAHAPMLAPGVALPETMTTLSPPMPGDHTGPRWNEVSGAWELVPDYRGFTYWTADGTQHTVDALGVEPPAGYLTLPPAPAEDVQT